MLITVSLGVSALSIAMGIGGTIYYVMKKQKIYENNLQNDTDLNIDSFDHCDDAVEIDDDSIEKIEESISKSKIEFKND
jgi:hypothetical protein